MWKKIRISKHFIQCRSGKSLKIKFPNKSKYSGYSVWVSLKLIDEDTGKNYFFMLYKTDFIFHIKKYGKGQYNKFDVIRSKEISASEFVNEFDYLNGSDDIPEIHTPEPLKAEKTEVLEELLDE